MNGVVLLLTFFSIRILYGWYLTIDFMHTLFAAGVRVDSIAPVPLGVFSRQSAQKRS